MRTKKIDGSLDPFKILGVSPDADELTIKRAYRRLAKTYHPDLNEDDSQAEKRFKQVQWAYESIMGTRDRSGLPDRTGWYAGSRGFAAQYNPHPIFGFYWKVQEFLEKNKQ